LIPAIAGGGFVVLLAVNIGLFFTFFGGSSEPAAQQVEANPTDSTGIGHLASHPAQAAPVPIKPVSPPKNTKKPTGPKVAAVPVDDAPDRLMNTSEIVAKYEPSVALIKGKKGSGTGFIARPGIVATNAHVIDNERIKDIEVRFPSAEETKQGPYPAKLLFQDRDRDLALLGVATQLPAVKIAEKYKFRKGEDVTVIGNPGVGGQMILENAISRGIVSSMTKIKEHTFLQLGISINPGNSGGPVFDPKGRVIGVVTLKTTQQEGLAFAVPAEDLLSALETAQTMIDNGPADDTSAASGGASTSRSNAPNLAYAWKLGQTYVYSFELILEAGTNILNLKGYSVYRVKAVDGDGITLGHRGWYAASKRGEDGKVLPGGMGPARSIEEIEIKIDPKGEVLKASGSSTLPLVGDLSMLVIEPLPNDPTRTWDDSRTISLNEDFQVPGSDGGIPRLGKPGVNNLLRGGAKARIAERRQLNGRQPAPAQPPSQPTDKIIVHEATEETNYTLGELKGDTAPIRKMYELATREMVREEPRLKMTGDGTLEFDVKSGIPVSLEYRLTVSELTSNATFRLPIKVTCKLLEGKDRENGLRTPVNNPSAMNKLDSGELSNALAGLKSPDDNKRKEACRFLFDALPIENKRGEVSRALEKLATHKDMGVKSEVIKAMGVWGDAKIVDKLIASLADESYGVRDELFEALSRLSPTEKAAEAIIPWLEKDGNRANKALRAIGPPAEGALLRAAEEGTVPKVRVESVRLLKELGTSQSIPVLQKMVQLKQGIEIGRVADEAIKNIQRRWPTGDDWAVLLKQARTNDGGKRREAADRLMQMRPIEARRAEVVAVLEKLSGDGDGGIQTVAIRALSAWGTVSSRPVLIELLQDPDLRPVRDTIEALVNLGPDEASARAIAGRIIKDRGAVIEALAAMGPIAENAALSALENVGNDGGARNDLYKLLAKIGSEASRDVLQKATTEPHPRVAQAALKDLIERLSGDDTRLSSALDDLTSDNRGHRSQAVQKMATMPMLASGKEKAARALDPLWDVDDSGLKQSLREAIIRWGDDKSADFLAERLAKPDFKQWEEAMKALVALRPDARTAELLVARFTQNTGLVYEIAKKMAITIDQPMLAIVKQEGENRWRIEACKALGMFGTPAVIPVLQGLARHAGDDELVRETEDALKNITAQQ
jgi:S1-C subfamily serine protease/HEAT repeat protein